MTEFNRADYMTTGQAAAALLVSTETIRRWCGEGKLRCVRTASNRFLVSRASVQPHLPTLTES